MDESNLIRLTAELSTKGDDAWHSLVEADPQTCNHVIRVFKETQDLDKRLALVSVIAHYRTTIALEFLATQLASEEDAIWKASLDELVSIGGSKPLQILEIALTKATGEKREWLAEGKAQVQNPSMSGS
jgi:hypothetical protein